MSDQTGISLEEFLESLKSHQELYFVELSYPSSWYMDTNIEEGLMTVIMEDTTRAPDENRFPDDSGMGFGWRNMIWNDLTKESADALEKVIKEFLNGQFPNSEWDPTIEAEQPDKYYLAVGSEDENAPEDDDE